jgi:protein-tyrosine phosphatase
MACFPSAVLFACTMNAIRSPIASGLMKMMHGTRVYVTSVGVHEGVQDGFAIKVMEEIGVDISSHVPRTFDDLEDDSFDVIVSLSPEAQHKAVEMTRHMSCDVLFWNTFDPSLATGSWEERADAYRRIRDELEEKIYDAFPVRTVSHT